MQCRVFIGIPGLRQPDANSTPHPCYDIQKCVETLPGVSWGTKLPVVLNLCLAGPRTDPSLPPPPQAAQPFPASWPDPLSPNWLCKSPCLTHLLPSPHPPYSTALGELMSSHQQTPLSQALFVEYSLF